MTQQGEPQGSPFFVPFLFASAYLIGFFNSAMSNTKTKTIKSTRTYRPRNATQPLPPRVMDTLGGMTVQQADTIARMVCSGLFPMLNKALTECECIAVPVYSFRRGKFDWVHIQQDGNFLHL